MRTLLSCPAHVNQVVARNCRSLQIDRLCRSNKRRSALAKFVDTGYINHILCQVFQVLYGIAVIFQSGNLLVTAGCTLFVVKVVCDSILHLFPGHRYTLVVAHRLYIVRFIRFFGRLRSCLYRLTVSAAPGAVDRLHTERILCVIL